MKRYRFTSAALTELKQATLFYQQRENGLGPAFLDEIEATFLEFCNTRTRRIHYLREHAAVELIAFRSV